MSHFHAVVDWLVALHGVQGSCDCEMSSDWSTHCLEQDQQYPQHLGHTDSDRAHPITWLTVRRNFAHCHGSGLWNKYLTGGGDGGKPCMYRGCAV